MVRHEIQHQLDVALGESLAKLRQRRIAPDLVADRVGGDAKPEPHMSSSSISGRTAANSARHSDLLARDGPARGTGPPDAQQPNPVEALPSEAVDRGVVNFGQSDLFAALMDRRRNQTRVLS